MSLRGKGVCFQSVPGRKKRVTGRNMKEERLSRKEEKKEGYQGKKERKEERCQGMLSRKVIKEDYPGRNDGYQGRKEE
jgi:hypothetical protein